MGSGNDINNKTSSGTGVWSSDGHGYCLRWNNHKSNLVEILEALIKMECYVDCTIYVDNHVQFKAHRVVLAACSPYFQAILQDAPQDHCSIIFPGVQEFEMRTLLEYIYAGEVNIAESQIPRIMKIAKMLEVKGLLDMVDLTSNISQQQHSSLTSPPSGFRLEAHPINDTNNKQSSIYPLHPLTHSSPIISTSTKISLAQSSSSPPYNYKSPYVASIFSQSSSASRDLLSASSGTQDDRGMAGDEERVRSWPPPLPLSSLSRSAQSMLSSAYETGGDMNPLKRKKLSSISSMLMTRDTPILRNVLAQSNAADSSQNALPLNVNISPSRGGNSNDHHDNNDTNNNENSNANVERSAGLGIVGGNGSANNGSVYLNYGRKSGDRSYHSSNGSDNSDKVSILIFLDFILGVTYRFFKF
jgi:BTB/POZ domain